MLVPAACFQQALQKNPIPKSHVHTPTVRRRPARADHSDNRVFFLLFPFLFGCFGGRRSYPHMQCFVHEVGFIWKNKEQRPLARAESGADGRRGVCVCLCVYGSTCMCLCRPLNLFDRHCLPGAKHWHRQPCERYPD